MTSYLLNHVPSASARSQFLEMFAPPLVCGVILGAYFLVPSRPETSSISVVLNSYDTVCQASYDVHRRPSPRYTYTGFNPEIQIWEIFGVVRGDSGRLFGSVFGLLGPDLGHLGPHLGHLGSDLVQNTPRTC